MKSAAVNRKNKICEPIPDRIFNFINNLFLLLAFLMVAYPLLFILSASVSDSSAVIRGEVWLLPVGFDLKAYESVFKSSMIMTGYLNSVFLYRSGNYF